MGGKCRFSCYVSISHRFVGEAGKCKDHPRGHIAVSLSFKNDQTVGNRERTKGKEGKIEMEIENDLTEGLLLPSLSPAYD